MISLISIFVGCVGQAAECPNRDLRKPAMGKPRDQGDSGWCFAYATADLLSFELNKKISASDIAIDYLASYKGPLTELANWLQKSPDDGGGTEVGAFNSIRKRGLCLESKMPSTPDAFREYLLLRGRDLTTEPFAKDYIERCVNPKESCKFDSSLFNGENFCAILASLANHTPTAFSNKDFESYREKTCGKRLDIPENLKIAKMWASDGSLSDAIRAKIRQGKPVAIDYRSIITGDSKTWHSSTIVGSRSKNGSCEYLVRLTIGPSCKNIKAKFECDKSEPGNAWVKEEDLLPSLRSISFFNRGP